MLLKKDFEGVSSARLIQERHIMGNIDPKNRLLGVKNCTLAVGRRLFQQHRPNSEVEHSILL
jgi:hypothetical protein